MRNEMKSELMVSVIVPIYNRGYCLRRCLDSIVKQSYISWECILVDDGSTDETYEIGKEYVQQDSRFKLFYQENAGVSAARNKGLEEAAGDYIAFIDSDDDVAPDYLKRLIEVMGDSDVSVCGIDGFKDDRWIWTKKLPESVLLLEPVCDDTVLASKYATFLFCSVCKLYKRQVIEAHAVRFQRGISFGEDLIFNFTYLLYARKIQFISEGLYHVNVTENSLCAHPERQPAEAHLLCFESIRKFYEKKKLRSPSAYRDLCVHYSGTHWMIFYLILYKHADLSLKGRYVYLMNVYARMDLSYVNQAVTFPAWKRFLLKHPRLYWILAEVKYGLKSMNEFFHTCKK